MTTGKHGEPNDYSRISASATVVQIQLRLLHKMFTSTNIYIYVSMSFKWFANGNCTKDTT